MRGDSLFTLGSLLDEDGWSLPRMALMARGLLGRGLWDFAPLRPSWVASRMRVSLSMRPALRKALAAMARLPAGGVGVDSMG